jgi:hypothetical protein
MDATGWTDLPQLGRRLGRDVSSLRGLLEGRNLPQAATVDSWVSDLLSLAEKEKKPEEVVAWINNITKPNPTLHPVDKLLFYDRGRIRHWPAPATSMATEWRLIAYPALIADVASEGMYLYDLSCMCQVFDIRPMPPITRPADRSMALKRPALRRPEEVASGVDYQPGGMRALASELLSTAERDPLIIVRRHLTQVIEALNGPRVTPDLVKAFVQGRALPTPKPTAPPEVPEAPEAKHRSLRRFVHVLHDRRARWIGGICAVAVLAVLRTSRRPHSHDARSAQ